MPQPWGGGKARAGAAPLAPLLLPGEPPLTVSLRAAPRARRLTLRVAPGGRLTLSGPPGMTRAEAAAFAAAREGWIRARLAERPPPPPLAPGVRLPVEGRPLPLLAAPGRAARVEGGALLVPEGAAGPAVAALLKALARERLGAACAVHAAALGRAHGRIALRDPRSRWGSCTAAGNLMFSWRLAMAPPEVLSYVAAHEVAHLVRMDHSPAFWAAVERLDPKWRAARAWLRAEGPGLLAVRFD